MPVLDSVEIFIQNPQDVYSFELDQKNRFFVGLIEDLQRVSTSQNLANQELRIKARYFFVHTLLNEIGLNQEQQQQVLLFDWNEVYQNGKLSFSDQTEIFFNWSHTAEFLALAFSSAKVGVDVEKIQARHSLWQNEQKAQKIFTNFERQSLLVTEDDQSFWIRFFEIWTQKESVLKMHRQGLAGLKLLNEGKLVAAKMESFEFEHWILSVSCSQNLNFRIHTPTMHQV